MRALHIIPLSRIRATPPKRDTASTDPRCCPRTKGFSGTKEWDRNPFSRTPAPIPALIGCCFICDHFLFLGLHLSQTVARFDVLGLLAVVGDDSLHVAEGCIPSPTAASGSA